MGFFPCRIPADRALRHKLCTVLHLYHQAFMIVTYFTYINDFFFFKKIKNQARHVHVLNHQVLEIEAEMLEISCCEGVNLLHICLVKSPLKEYLKGEQK